MTIRPAIARMSGYVPGEQPQGGKFIKLNTNENPYPPSPQVAVAIQSAVAAGLQRYPDPMATGFRVRAGEILGFPPSWILCGNGSDDLLTIITRTYVGEGDCLRLPYPSYILYRTLAELQDATAEEIPFRDDWTLGDDFTRARDRLRLAVIPNPNSPSGTLLTPEQISSLAERLTCPLLVDEAYVDFAETNCLDLVRRHPQVLVSRSLSKSYGLAGLRFGFVVARPEVIEQLVKVKDSYNCDALSIAGAIAAIGDQGWLVANRTRIMATRVVLERKLRDFDFHVFPSQANFVWCTHPRVAARSIYEGLKARQVLVRYMNYPGWGDGLRISVGTDEQIAAFLSLLPAVLAENG